MKKIALLSLATFVFLSSCATIQTKMGNMVVKFMTKKEKDFTQMAAIGQYNSNMYSPETGITLGGDANWKEGESVVGVQLVKPDGSIGFISLDGVVTVNGDTAEAVGGGFYMSYFPAEDKSPKKVKLVNVDGETTEFMMSPLPSVRIKSINGKTENSEIDMTKPLELELEFDEEARGKRITISLITNAMSVKGFAMFQSAQLTEKLTIHPDAFKHKHISSTAGKDPTKWDLGENHLQVAIVEHDRSENKAPFSYFKKVQNSYDTKKGTLSGEIEGRGGVAIKGKKGEFNYAASSSNAWYSRPLDSNLKRIGVGSIAVSGTLYKQEKEVSEEESFDVRVITTTTTTWQFPELDDEYWNQFLESLYADVNQILRQDFNATIVDVNEITNHPAYGNFFTPEDENNKEYIAKNLRNTKRLSPLRIGEILSDRKTIFIADADPSPTILRELELDAMLNLTINYQVGNNAEGLLVLIPYVTFQVLGDSQAHDGFSHEWLQGYFNGPGVPFSESEFSNLNALNRIGQKDMIIDLLRQSLKELTEEQAKFGYQNVWEIARKK